MSTSLESRAGHDEAPSRPNGMELSCFGWSATIARFSNIVAAPTTPIGSYALYSLSLVANGSPLPHEPVDDAVGGVCTPVTRRPRDASLRVPARGLCFGRFFGMHHASLSAIPSGSYERA